MGAFSRLLCFASLLSLALAGIAAGQDDGSTYVPRDDQVDALLHEGRDLEAAGKPEEAARAYVLALKRLAERHRSDPTARVVVPSDGSPDVFEGAERAIRRRLQAMPAPGLERYRTEVDPHVAELLQRADLDLGDPSPLEEIVAHYPLATAEAGALDRLADLMIERGLFQSALAVLELGGASETQARVAMLRERLSSRREVDPAIWPMAGGGPDRSRAVSGPIPGPLRVDMELPSPEVTPAITEGFARRGRRPPLVYHPVTDGKNIFVADSKSVFAIDRGRGEVRWVFVAIDETASPSDQALLPERLENMAFSVAVEGGRVFATLNRNTPALWPPAAPRAGPTEGAPGKPSREIEPERRKDYRFVALDAVSGRLIWDAATRPELEDLSRGAVYVTPPLVCEDRVYLGATTFTQGNYQTFALALDAATGQLVWRTFICSGSPDDYRGLATESSPLLEAEGQLIFSTNLGTVACLSPQDGAITWAARYRTIPPTSQKRIIRDRLRFALGVPRVVAGNVVVAPQDSSWLHAYALATGREVWRFPREASQELAGITGGDAVVVGHGFLAAIDGSSGELAWRAPEPPHELRGTPCVTRERVYVCTSEKLLTYRAADGRLESSLRLGPRGAIAGNVLALGEQLIIGGESGVVILDGRPPGPAREGQRTSADPGAELAAGTYLARFEEAAGTDRREEALAHLERALELSGGEGPGVPAQARSEAFALASQAAEAAFSAGDERAALAWTQRALRLVWVEPESLSFLLTAADQLEKWGRGREAAQVWQKMLKVDRDLELPLPLAETRYPGHPAAARRGSSPAAAPAGAYARMRLFALRRTAGAGALVDIDREAAKLLDAARQAGTPEAYERVIDEYPTTPGEKEALLALGSLYERRDLANLAERSFARFADRYADDPRVPGVLYRLARLLERTNRTDEERRVLERLRDRFHDALIQTERGGVAAGAFAEARLSALAALDDGPALPLGAAEDLGLSRAFQTWVDLEDDEPRAPRLVLPRGFDADTAAIFFVAGGRSIEARQIDTGTLVWRRDFEDLRRQRVGVAGSTVVLSSGKRIEAVDLRRGVLLWRWEARTLAQARPATLPPLPDEPSSTSSSADPRVAENARTGASPTGETPSAQLPLQGEARDALQALEQLLDPDALKGLTVVHDRVVAVFARDVVTLEAASGRVEWRHHGSEALGGNGGDPIALERGTARGGATPLGASPPTCVVVGAESPARLIAFDLGTGAEVYSLPLGASDPRMSLRPVASDDGRRIFCVVAGSDLVGVDATAGVELWKRRLPFWTREIVCPRDGAAVAVLAHPAPDQPKLGVYEGSTGVPVFEDRTERSRVGPAVFDGKRLYVFAGDFLSGRVRCIDWRGGKELWSWIPQRGQAFSELAIAGGRLILPQTAQGGPGIVYILDRERGSIYRSFPLDGRRVTSAAVQGNTLLVTTTRGFFGFARLDPDRLRDEQAELAESVVRNPDDMRLRALLADRRFKLGDIEGAIATCESALLNESVGIAEYDLIYQQMLGFLEARPPSDQIEIGRLPRPPEIDGDLRDWWPLQQSVELASPRYVAPIQGYPGVAVLRGKDDLSATMYLGYDDRYFYFALDVEDSTLVPYDSESDEWRGDCLLIAIDTLGDGGDSFRQDDNLLSLALTLPKKNKHGAGQGDEEKEPAGKYFVKRKEDGSGAVYEAAIPWESFREHQAEIDPVQGPRDGFTFGFNVVITDDDDNRGAKKALSWTPSITLHREKHKLWHGFVPGRFGKIICR